MVMKDEAMSVKIFLFLSFDDLMNDEIALRHSFDCCTGVFYRESRM